MKLADQLATKDLVVFLGTGGVGKTTIAATAALQASKTRRTLVLTIDPARRLADSLGIKLGSEVVPVKDNLDALMLDTKAALDSLITRYAPNQEVLGRIFKSRFYEQISDAFAGSEEFVAMGTLHDLVQDGGYDVIIVDTPPSSHAVDFLEVNAKLIRVYESGVVKYLFKPTRFLRMGGGAIANLLARWTSSEYLEEFAEFMTTFDQMFLDMETRVRTMQAIITDSARTSVNLVTSAEEESVPQTIRLYEEVTRKVKLPVAACIVNRYYPRIRGTEVAELLEGDEFRAGAKRRLAEATKTSADDAEAFLADAIVAARFYDAIARDHEKYADKLRETLPITFHSVTALTTSVHDLAGLEAVRHELFDRK